MPGLRIRRSVDIGSQMQETGPGGELCRVGLCQFRLLYSVQKELDRRPIPGTGGLYPLVETPVGLTEP